MPTLGQTHVAHFRARFLDNLAAAANKSTVSEQAGGSLNYEEAVRMADQL